jgi:hypothetical protein
MVTNARVSLKWPLDRSFGSLEEEELALDDHFDSHVIVQQPGGNIMAAFESSSCIHDCVPGPSESERMVEKGPL